jgi:hypothetical protein
MNYTPNFGDRVVFDRSDDKDNPIWEVGIIHKVYQRGTEWERYDIITFETTYYNIYRNDLRDKTRMEIFINEMMDVVGDNFGSLENYPIQTAMMMVAFHVGEVLKFDVMDNAEYMFEIHTHLLDKIEQAIKINDEDEEFHGYNPKETEIAKSLPEGSL